MQGVIVRASRVCRRHKARRPHVVIVRTFTSFDEDKGWHGGYIVLGSCIGIFVHVDFEKYNVLHIVA